MASSAPPPHGSGSSSTPADTTSRESRLPPAPEDVDGCSRTVYFARVPPTVSTDELLELFSTCGTVSDIEVFRPWTNAKYSKGCGLVQYESLEGVKKALECLNGLERWPIAFHPLLVEPMDHAKLRRRKQAIAAAALAAANAAASAGRSAGASSSSSTAGGKATEQARSSVGSSNHNKAAIAPGMQLAAADAATWASVGAGPPGFQGGLQAAAAGLQQPGVGYMRGHGVLHQVGPGGTHVAGPRADALHLAPQHQLPPGVVLAGPLQHAPHLSAMGAARPAAMQGGLPPAGVPGTVLVGPAGGSVAHQHQLLQSVLVPVADPGQPPGLEPTPGGGNLLVMGPDMTWVQGGQVAGKPLQLPANQAQGMGVNWGSLAPASMHVPGMQAQATLLPLGSVQGGSANPALPQPALHLVGQGVSNSSSHMPGVGWVPASAGAAAGGDSAVQRLAALARPAAATPVAVPAGGMGMMVPGAGVPLPATPTMLQPAAGARQAQAGDSQRVMLQLSLEQAAQVGQYMQGMQGVTGASLGLFTQPDGQPLLVLEGSASQVAQAAQLVLLLL